MDEDLARFLAILIAASVGYAKLLGGYQTTLSQWVIDGFRVRSCWRGLVNLAVGIVLALAIAGVAAWKAGDVSLLPFGILSGVLASVEAAKVHDQQEPR